MAGPSVSMPATIGRYRVDAVLGQGAMGIVYKAYDTQIDRWVALKTVRPELLDCTDSAAWLARFQQEARAVARCQHPNIVTVYEYGCSGPHDLPYIVLEFVSGQELKKVLRGQSTGSAGIRQPVILPVRSALYIVIQVLDALDCAHRNGVVHRDIKPANILLVADGTIKVTDFGVARIDTSTLTQTGMMIGTPGHMAPEQFRGEPATALSDIYACGALLYELLSGARPFTGGNSSEIMYNVLNREPTFKDAASGRRIAPAFRAVIGKALAKDPAARFQTARQFANTLEQLAGQF